MIRRHTLLAWLLLSIAPALQAETLADAAAVTSFSDAFVAKIQTTQVKDAFDSARPFLGVDATAFDKSAAESVSQLTEINKQIGKPIAAALVETAVIGEHFRRHRYLVKYAQAALVWELTFYQPDKGWGLIGVNYTTDLDPLYRVAPTP